MTDGPLRNASAMLMGRQRAALAPLISYRCLTLALKHKMFNVTFFYILKHDAFFPGYSCALTPPFLLLYKRISHQATVTPSAGHLKTAPHTRSARATGGFKGVDHPSCGQEQLHRLGDPKEGRGWVVGIGFWTFLTGSQGKTWLFLKVMFLF